MTLDDVTVVGGPRVRATARQVDALAAELWIEWPAGYRKYVTTLGEGVLGGDYVRVYPPWRIAAELAEWRQRVSKYWFWDRGRKKLPKARGVECVMIGDTVDGDELVFHPCRPDRLFVLPRNSEQVFDAGPDLLAAIDWMCGSGKLTRPFRERNFVPFDSRAIRTSQEKPADPDGEGLDELVAAVGRWVKRHNARSRATKSAASVIGPDRAVKLRHEGVISAGEYPHQPGVLVVFDVTAAAGGPAVGTFTWYADADTEGGMFVPAAPPKKGRG